MTIRFPTEISISFDGLESRDHDPSLSPKDYPYWTSNGYTFTCPVCGKVSDRAQGIERFAFERDHAAWCCSIEHEDEWRQRVRVQSRRA